MDGIWQDLFVAGIPIAEKVMRTILVYAFLVIGLRIFGKRELGQLNPLDMIILLLLSNTVQNAIIGNDNSLIGGLTGATVLFLINATIVRAAYRNPRLRRMIEGRPEMLIQDGRIIHPALARNSLSREELIAAARKEGIDSLADVGAARLEVSGDITFTRHETGDAQSHFRAQVLERLASIEKKLAAGRA